ncbi:MAG: tetratricopeptide repeat protein [Anaerolineae bacterium]|nr:tetratricopeptide repeat protein [Anaerolineae bacterium]
MSNNPDENPTPAAEPTPAENPTPAAEPTPAENLTPAAEPTPVETVEEKPLFTFEPVDKPDDPATPYLAPDLPPYFIPRRELAELKKLLLSRPTSSLAPLTLFGPSGSGKTSLAIALAHDADMLKTFPDGVLWYSLGDNGDVQHAQSVWGKALGFDLDNLPDTASRAVRLRTRLRDAHALLIIDDVTDVEQVKALNVGGPGCARLITTDKGDEITFAFKTRRFELDQVSEEEALDLLVRWAGMLPDIYLPTVKEIVKRLAYSPLTLALVGAQARQGITWLRLLEILRDDQGPIVTLDPDEPETRQNALGLVINLVLSRFGSAGLQRAIELGAFAAGTGSPFSVGAAAACWKMEEDDARSTLDTLVGASIIQRLPDDLFALHRSLRDHLRRSARPGVVETAEERIRNYYITQIEQASAPTREIDSQIGQVMAAYNQITAVDSSRSDLFADALMSYFEKRGLWSNFVRLARHICDAARIGGDVIREYSTCSDLGYAYTILGQYDEAKGCFERSLAVSRELGDTSGEASALNNLGAILERQGAYLEALNHYQESLNLQEDLGMPEDTAEALNNVAGVLYRLEQWDDALKGFQRSLDMYTVLNDRNGQAQIWLNIGAVYERLGHDDESESAYQRSLAIYTNQGHEIGQSQALNNLGIIYFNQNEPDRALSHFKRSLALKEKLGDRHGEASTLNNIALLYERTGSIALALEHFEQSFQILDVLDDPRADVVRGNIERLREEMDK